MLPLFQQLSCMNKGRNFSQLSDGERIKIEVLLQQGLSFSGIGRQLGRSISTISREVKRNGPRQYKAVRAQYFTEKRHRHKHKHIVFTQAMRDFIELHLRTNRWSPEFISVKGRKWRPDFVSHEWIYRWIWAMKFSMYKTHKKYQLLYRYLKHGSGRKRRGVKHSSRGTIVGRQWIDQRPVAAALRRRQGDLEADIVLGRDRQPGLLVALDRKTRKTWMKKIKSKEASHVMDRLSRICSLIGNVRTVTLDNDQGFAHHYKLNKMGIKTFFTHPNSSQEKGSVENRIGVIRRFFPKKTDFTLVSEQQIKKVEQKINHRPMRMFNYKSPNEIYIS